MIQEEPFVAEVTALTPTLYRIGVSILRSGADAQDAVQQALARAWERRQTAHPEQFRAWLTRIVVNECRNIQRYRMRVLPVETMADEPVYDPPDTGLREALDALSEKLRTPLLLKYMEEYSEKEIAKALMLPLTTVKNRLFRARRALQKNLSEKEDSRLWEKNSSAPTT